MRRERCLPLAIRRTPSSRLAEVGRAWCDAGDGGVNNTNLYSSAEGGSARAPSVGFVYFTAAPTAGAPAQLAIPRFPAGFGFRHPGSLILIDMLADPAIESDKDAQPRCHEEWDADE
jgi:hypothetical protein